MEKVIVHKMEIKEGGQIPAFGIQDHENFYIQRAMPRFTSDRALGIEERYLVRLCETVEILELELTRTQAALDAAGELIDYLARAKISFPSESAGSRLFALDEKYTAALASARGPETGA